MVVDAETLLALPAETVFHLFADVPSWPLWIPPIVAVAHLAGPRTGQGAVNLIALGSPAVHTDILHKTVLVSPRTLVYAGRGGRMVRFLDVVDIEESGAATRVRRRLDLRVGRAAAVLAPVITTLSRRLADHSLALLR